MQFVTDGSLLKVDINDMCDLQMVYNDNEYLLKSIEFHSPSEHTLGGGHFDGEVQLIHYHNETKSTVIVSVFLEVSSSSIQGNSNAFLDTVWQAADYDTSNYNVTVSGSSLSLDPYAFLLPSTPGQFHYSGTRTTPPCKTAEWFIYQQPVSVSYVDIEYMRLFVSARNYDSLSSYGNNNRPIQSLQDRDIVYIPGGYRPTYSPTAGPSHRPSTAPTHAPTVFIHPGPYKVKVKSAMIVACLALSLTGIVVVMVVVWQIYTAFVEKDWSSMFSRSIEMETSLPV
jgi:carbonic anhydrase